MSILLIAVPINVVHSQVQVDHDNHLSERTSDLSQGFVSETLHESRD